MFLLLPLCVYNFTHFLKVHVRNIVKRCRGDLNFKKGQRKLKAFYILGDFSALKKAICYQSP